MFKLTLSVSYDGNKKYVQAVSVSILSRFETAFLSCLCQYSMTGIRSMFKLSLSVSSDRVKRRV